MTPMPEAPERHVIFGSGQVGPHLAAHLRDAGKQVVVVKRSAGGAPEGIDVEQGDATDAAFGSAEENVCGKVWMLPCQPAGSLRDLVQGLAQALGRLIGITRMPRWMLRSLGLFVGIVRELEEMSYQWDEPFVVRDDPWRERFGDTTTARDEACRQTVAWALEHYGG